MSPHPILLVGGSGVVGQHTARTLRKAHPDVPLLIGGPSQRERAAAEVVMDSTRATRNGLGNSVRRMMWMVDGVDLLVSTDTGPLHLAHAPARLAPAGARAGGLHSYAATAAATASP